MPSLDELNASFAIPGILVFDEPHPGLPRALVTTPACTAELYLHGAHLTAWHPTAPEANGKPAQPVIFLSPNSLLQPGKPIRGGIPVIFPWFGARTTEITGHRTSGSQHGFARTQEWQLAFAAQSGDTLRLTLTLGPSEESRAAGFDGFRVALEFTLGATLTLRMTVANESAEPLVYEQALHTYFHVGDPTQLRIHGLANTEFLDKTENFARKTQHEDPLTLCAQTDRPYLNTTATVTLEDPALGRCIVVAKSGSATTVVWNPWEKLSASLPDLGAGQWRHFTCVETANAGEDRITLAPHSAHVMEARISREPVSSRPGGTLA
jgi:glucose-6-phosphate 1-epimerase